MTDTDLFSAAVAIVLEEEGVFSADAQDPGGATYYGIARAAHPEFKPWPPTKDQATALYRVQYWDAHRCGEMPWPWAVAIFDGEVNQGSVIRLAQQALGLTQDGAVGPATLAAMTQASPALFDEFLGLRALAYTRDAGFSHDGKGWLTRIARVARGAAQSALA
jgi:lysozyme family protein